MNSDGGRGGSSAPCDYAEASDSPEATASYEILPTGLGISGTTVGVQALCAELDPANASSEGYADYDMFEIQIEGPADVKVPLRFDLEALVPDGVDEKMFSLDIMTDTYLLAGATSLRGGSDHGLYEHEFIPGTYYLGIGFYGELGESLPYRVSVETVELNPCAAVNVLHTEQEGAVAGENDVVIFSTNAATASPDDAPEESGITLAPGEGGCIEGVVVEAEPLPEETSPYFANTGDRDMYRIAVGPGVGRIDARLTRLDGTVNMHADVRASTAGDQLVEIDYLDMFTARTNDEREILFTPPDQEYLVTVTSWLPDMPDAAALPATYQICFCAQ